MKKLLIGFIFLSCLFTSCLILKQAPEETVEIVIYNKCPWAMDIEINYPDYAITNKKIRIGEKGVKNTFYKDIPINLFFKGSYDYYSKRVYLPTGVSQNDTWVIDWSTYHNSYVFTRNGEKKLFK